MGDGKLSVNLKYSVTDGNNLSKTFSLIEYLDKFSEEELCNNPYEIENSTRKEWFVKFKISPLKLAEEGRFYSDYIKFEIESITVLSLQDFREILNTKSYDFYYNYYTYLTPIRFAVLTSYAYLGKKFKLKLNNSNLTLNTDSINYLKLMTIVNIYDTLDMDNFECNRFYKKRVIERLLEIVEVNLNTHVKFNEVVKLIGDGDKSLFFNQFKVFFYKNLCYIEEILISLCFGLPYVSYAQSYGSTLFESQKNKIHTQSTSPLEDNCDTGDHNNLKENLLSTIESSELYVEKEAVRYTRFGVRYLKFSKQIQFVRDITLDVFKYPPVLQDNKLYFMDKSKRYDIFIYNAANTKDYSDFKFNEKIIQKIASIPLTFNKELFNLINILFLKKFSKKTTISIKTKFHSINYVFNNLFMDKKNVSLYFPYCVDFRGRIYITSPLSITDIKLLRFIIIPHRISQKKFVKHNVFYHQFYKYVYLLHNLRGVDCTNFLDEKKILILLGLLNLGKIKKSALIVSCSVSLESFIQKGIEIFNISNDLELIKVLGLDDIDDIGYILTMKSKLYDYIFKDCLFSIIVDSTASGIFHLNLWLQVKDEYIKYINLSSEDNWYDTYSFLFTKTKELMGNLFPNHLEYLFTRKRLKKVFMTIPYNATKSTLRNYFCTGMTDSELSLIKPYLNDFFNYIYLVFDEIFLNKFKNLHQLQNFNNSYKFKLNENLFDFTYYKTDIKEHEIQVRGLRWTYSERIILTMEMLDKLDIKKKKENLENKSIKKKTTKHKNSSVTNIDHKKSLTAFPANVMHCTDASFLNLIYLQSYKKGIYIHTIHDEFIVSVNTYFDFLETVNDVYSSLYSEINNTSKPKFQSLFILL